MTANLNTIIIRYVHDNYSIHRLFVFKLLLEKVLHTEIITIRRNYKQKMQINFMIIQMWRCSHNTCITIMKF